MSTTTDTRIDADTSRLMGLWVERAQALPAEAERILRDGLEYVSGFGAGAVLDDEPALIRAAQRYVDRHYPLTEVGAA